MTELGKILKGDEAFLESLSKKGRKGTSTSPPAPPAAKPGRISPVTSLAEDLQQTRETLHAELKQTSDDNEAEDTPDDDESEDTSSDDEAEDTSSETGSDFDSDTDSGASYVDLTGGATPTILEEGSEHGEEWAVVQE